MGLIYQVTLILAGIMHETNSVTVHGANAFSVKT